MCRLFVYVLPVLLCFWSCAIDFLSVLHMLTKLTMTHTKLKCHELTFFNELSCSCKIEVGLLYFALANVMVYWCSSYDAAHMPHRSHVFWNRICDVSPYFAFLIVCIYHCVHISLASDVTVFCWCCIGYVELVSYSTRY